MNCGTGKKSCRIQLVSSIDFPLVLSEIIPSAHTSSLRGAPVSWPYVGILVSNNNVHIKFWLTNKVRPKSENKTVVRLNCVWHGLWIYGSVNVHNESIQFSASIEQHKILCSIHTRTHTVCVASRTNCARRKHFPRQMAIQPTNFI